MTSLQLLYNKKWLKIPSKRKSLGFIRYSGTHVTVLSLYMSVAETVQFNIGTFCFNKWTDWLTAIGTRCVHVCTGNNRLWVSWVTSGINKVLQLTGYLWPAWGWDWVGTQTNTDYISFVNEQVWSHIKTKVHVPSLQSWGYECQTPMVCACMPRCGYLNKVTVHAGCKRPL